MQPFVQQEYEKKDFLLGSDNKYFKTHHHARTDRKSVDNERRKILLQVAHGWKVCSFPETRR